MAWVSRVPAGLILLQVFGIVIVLAVSWSLVRDLFLSQFVSLFGASIEDSPVVWAVLSYVFSGLVVLIALGVGISAINSVHKGGL